MEYFLDLYNRYSERVVFVPMSLLMQPARVLRDLGLDVQRPINPSLTDPTNKGPSVSENGMLTAVGKIFEPYAKRADELYRLGLVNTKKYAA